MEKGAGVAWDKGVSFQTFYSEWGRFIGMTKGELAKLKAPCVENAWL